MLSENSKLKTQTVNDKFKVADPYYHYDNHSLISSINDLSKLIEALQSELKEIDDPDYTNALKDVKHNLDYGIYFRGQSDCSYELVPAIGRNNKCDEPKYNHQQERNFLHRFRRRSYSHYERILTDWETIFLAQHHELPTRLLDWTSNQLVALFWACQSKKNSEKDGAVYAFVRQPDDEWDLNVFNARLCNNYRYAKDFKFLVKGVKVIYPFHVSPRITAHGGLFTIQDKPYQDLTEYPFKKYTRKYFDIFHIRKWKVPFWEKKEILKKLDEVGINIHTLFLDLNGLSKSLELTEEMRWSD